MLPASLHRTGANQPRFKAQHSPRFSLGTPTRLGFGQASSAGVVLPRKRECLSRANLTDELGNDNAAALDTAGNRPQLTSLRRVLWSTALVAAVTLTAAGSAHAAASRRLAVGTAAATSTVQTTPSRTSTSFASSVAVHQPSTWAVAQYQFSKVFALPTYGKLAAIIAIGLPIVVLGAALVRYFSGDHWRDAMLKSYYILNNVPGIDISQEESPGAVVVLNIIHILSLFTFASLVGVLTDEITSRVEEARAGNYRVLESGHTVVVGWSPRRSPAVLKAMLQNQAERGSLGSLPGPLVLLASTGDAGTDGAGGDSQEEGGLKKSEVDAALLEELGEALGLAVITRTGTSTRTADLARVGAARASTIVWMLPPSSESSSSGEGKEGDENADDEARAATLTAFLSSLHTLRREEIRPDGHGPPQSIVIQADASLQHWPNTLAGQAAAGLARSNGAELTLVNDVSNSLAGIMAQAAVQPGLCRVFERLCLQSSGTSEFYITQPVPELIGRTFGEARRVFPTATLCGLVGPSFPLDLAARGTCTGGLYTVLSPPDTTILSPTHSLVFLADDAKCAAPDRQALKKLIPRLNGVDAIQAATMATTVVSPPPAPAPAPSSSFASALSSRWRKSKGAKAKVVVDDEAPRKVVVLVHAPPSTGDEDVATLSRLADGLAQFAPRGTNVTFVTEGSSAKSLVASVLKQLDPSAQKRIKFTTVHGSLASATTLLEAGVESADTVVLAPVGPQGPASDARILADVMSLGGFLQQRAGVHGGPSADALGTAVSGYSGGSSSTLGGTAVMEGSTASVVGASLLDNRAGSSTISTGKGGGGKDAKGTGKEYRRSAPLSVVCCVDEERTREVLAAVTHDLGGRMGQESAVWHKRSPWSLTLDVVVGEPLVSGMLAQVAAQPSLQGVVQQLLSNKQGCELYVRAPATYGISSGSGSCSWAEVQDRVREHGAVALGLLDHDTGESRLGITAHEAVDLHEGMRLVVLALD